MPALAVIGAAPSADALATATAVCLAARHAGLEPRVHVPVATGEAGPLQQLADAARQELDAIARRRLPHDVAPVVAARLSGETLDPAALAREAKAAATAPDGALAVVVLPGAGPLTPLTPRFAARDLLGDLGLPVVLAVASGRDALPNARLAVEGLRGAGLPVPAVILTGWPERPSRADHEERAVLFDALGGEVLVLPDPEAPRRFAVKAWTQAVARGGVGQVVAGVATPQARVLLEEYAAWTPSTPVPDPRVAKRPEIIVVMRDIIATEGPMTAARAYALYARASGGRKLTSVARAPLSSAVYWLAKDGAIHLTRAEDAPWQEDDLLRLPDAPAVRVRELGPRTLDEVPLDEIAALMRRLRDARGTGDPAQLKRAVLDAYGLTRMTGKADAYLDLALGLL